jgi:hypothetical protein
MQKWDSGHFGWGSSKFYPTRISTVSMIRVGQKRPMPKNIIFILSHILMVKAPYLKINKMVFFLKKKN